MTDPATKSPFTTAAQAFLIVAALPLLIAMLLGTGGALYAAGIRESLVYSAALTCLAFGLWRRWEIALWSALVVVALAGGFLAFMAGQMVLVRVRILASDIAYDVATPRTILLFAGIAALLLGTALPNLWRMRGSRD